MKNSNKQVSTLFALALAATTWSGVGLADLEDVCEKVQELEEDLLNLNDRNLTTTYVDNFNSGFELGNAAWFIDPFNIFDYEGNVKYSAFPGLFDAQVSVEQINGNNVAVIASNPHTFTSPAALVPDSGGLEPFLPGHGNNLDWTKAVFVAHDPLLRFAPSTEKIIEINVASESVFTPDPETGALHPFGSAVSNPNDDIRLSMSQVGIQFLNVDDVSAATGFFYAGYFFNFGFTNERVYLYFHRHQNGPEGVNSYIPIYERSNKNEFIKVAVGYVPEVGKLNIYINGELVYHLSEDAREFLNDDFVSLRHVQIDQNGDLNPGATQIFFETVDPQAFSWSVGLGAQLDASLSQAILEEGQPQKGLMQQVQDGFYKHPSERNPDGTPKILTDAELQEFFEFPGCLDSVDPSPTCSENNRIEQRLFGQGQIVRIKSIKFKEESLSSENIALRQEYRAFLEDNDCQNIEDESDSDSGSDSSSDSDSGSDDSSSDNSSS